MDSSGRPCSPCQGLISCLYSTSCEEEHAAQDTEKKTTKEILCDRIVGFYEEAFSRLPWEDMPDNVVLNLITTGGLCVGLLDPVSNIILNTICLRLSSSSPPKGISKSTWYIAASSSYLALVGFMLEYFGCLTEEQAGRYLRWADADLALAVLLVEHDLYGATTAKRLLPDPASARTQASLKIAVLRAGHPAPDRLVHLTASVFPPPRLEAVKPLLLATKLTVDDVRTILDLLFQNSPCKALLPQGGFGAACETTCYLVDCYRTTIFKPVGDHISSLRSRQDMESMKSSCLARAHSLRNRLKGECGESCEHLRSLTMCLRDTVHSLYLRAIALLPCQGVANRLIRDILVIGHCYGPLDPVANIIVNSIWHNRICPLAAADRIDVGYDILDTLSLLRTEVRSLEGIMDVVRAVDPALSTKQVVRSLCLTQCDITEMLQQRETRTSTRSSPDDLFLRAAVAAQHPLPAALALFHKQLAADAAKLDSLRSAISTSSVLSVGDIDRIADLVDQVFKITPEVQPSLRSQVPQLHKDAYSVMLRKRSEYEHQSKFIRSKVAQLLDKYAAQHPWEGKYTLGVICGVENFCRLFKEGCHVNFMAGSSKYGKNTVFFAEFWSTYPGDSKRDACCPLNLPYTGRCFYEKFSARKIVYPDSAEYFMCDVSAHGIGNVDGMIDTDFVYFDSERDVQFAKKVNSYHDKDSVLLRPVVLDTHMKMFNCIDFDKSYTVGFSQFSVL